MNPDSIDRRRFLGRTVATVTAAGALGWPRQGEAEDGPAAAAQTPRAPILRTLGRTGIRVPVVGMGCMNTFTPALIRRSYELGVRLFDTAAMATAATKKCSAASSVTSEHATTPLSAPRSTSGSGARRV